MLAALNTTGAGAARSFPRVAPGGTQQLARAMSLGWAILVIAILAFARDVASQQGTTSSATDVITVSGTTFLSSTRAATSSATSAAMTTLSTTSSVSSTTLQAETTSTAASATSLSTAVTAAALSLSTTSRTSTLAVSSTTSAQVTSTASFIASTSSQASLSLTSASSTTTAATTAASTTAHNPIAPIVVMLQVIFRAACVNVEAFMNASRVEDTFIMGYDGCNKNSTSQLSMLLVGADISGVAEQEAVLKV